MAQTATDLCNLALSAASSRGVIADFNEKSREAEECRLWYELARDTMLEGGYWPAAKAKARLALVEARTGDLQFEEYAFVFALPANCLRPWYTSSYANFELMFSETQNAVCLFTSAEEVFLTYSRSQPLIPSWTPSMKNAFVHGLAALIAPGLTGKSQTVSRNFQLANEYLNDAQLLSNSSEPQTDEYVPQKFLARGAGSLIANTRYIYPRGNGFSGVTQ